MRTSEAAEAGGVVGRAAVDGDLRSAGSDREAELRRRIAVLESERWRTFEDAQREADRVFAQYQLSQLLASGDSLRTMAEAVLEELLRHNGADAAALWLAAPGQVELDLIARISEIAEGRSDTLDEGTGLGHAAPPRRFANAAAVADWTRDHGWSGAVLEESRDLGESGVGQQGVGFVAIIAAPARALEPDHARFLALIRHELAIAFRAAQLRELLARERSILSAILDGATEAIVAVDRDRRVVRANVAALALLARGTIDGGRCDEAFGCRVPLQSGPAADNRGGRPDGVVDSLRCGPVCPFEEILAATSPVVHREQAIPVGDGDVPVAASYAQMPGPDAGAVAVLRDLRPGRAIDELKASFVAAMSHELRTPLALIGGYTDTLLHLDLDAARQRDYVEKIRRASEQLAGLVDEILEISTLESDRLAIDRRPVALADVVAALANDLAESPAPPRLSIRLAPALPMLDADPVRVRQVLDNLVSNAAKYGGADPEIRLLAQRDGELALVTVEDDGPGVDPDEREHVFEQFFRGRRVRSSRQPGSGLGLYLCRRLVEAHGGRIWLEARDRGTAVSFTLPLVARPRLRSPRTP